MFCNIVGGFLKLFVRNSGTPVKFENVENNPSYVNVTTCKKEKSRKDIIIDRQY